MRSNPEARGFSFLLDESPQAPPAEPRSRSSSAEGDLDLDFSELGSEAPSPDAPSPEPGEAHRRRLPTLLDSAPPPAVDRGAREPLDEPPARGLSARREPVKHNQARLGAAADVTPKDGARPRAPSLEPQGKLLRDKFGPARRSASGTAEATRGLSPADPEDPRAVRMGLDAPAAGLEGPRIKKIQFPAPKAAQTSAKSSPSPRTRFSDSVAPRVGAISRDATVEFDAAAEFDAARVDAAKLPAGGYDTAGDYDSAPPEDLPSKTTPYDPSEWGTGAPTAKELWERARVGLSRASFVARDASSRGWHRSQHVAGAVSRALQERLRARTSAGEPAEPPDPTPSHEPKAERAAPAQTGGARRFLGRVARGAAAPVAACAAAVVVYQAGSHFLGDAAGPGLSKTAPVVPDLGTLTQAPRGQALENAARPRAVATSPSASIRSNGPPAMQTEVVPMPDGMSWPGKGLIEVVTAEEELIYVDGVFTGRGPLRRIPVTPGSHEIKIKSGGSERQGIAEVELGRATRAVFAAGS